MTCERTVGSVRVAMVDAVDHEPLEPVVNISSKESMNWLVRSRTSARGSESWWPYWSNRFPGGLGGPDAGGVVRDPCEVHGAGGKVSVGVGTAKRAARSPTPQRIATGLFSYGRGSAKRLRRAAAESIGPASTDSYDLRRAPHSIQPPTRRNEVLLSKCLFSGV